MTKYIRISATSPSISGLLLQGYKVIVDDFYSGYITLELNKGV